QSFIEFGQSFIEFGQSFIEFGQSFIEFGQSFIRPLAKVLQNPTPNPSPQAGRGDFDVSQRRGGVLRFDLCKKSIEFGQAPIMHTFSQATPLRY
uniref:hypothetical protein n=1 Tax=Hassallia byssoidea TaxID=482630 RepID=UPI001F1B185B